MLNNLKGIHLDSPSIQFKLGDKVVLNLGSRSSGLSADAERMIERFRQLLAGHGLSEAQMLKLVPAEWEWHPGIIGDEQLLLAALRTDRLEWLSTTFGVERLWLEGGGDRIYRWPHGYKQHHQFAEQLAKAGWLGDGLRMTVLAEGYKSRTNEPLNRYTLVFSHPLAEWDDGETVIYRHLCYEPSVLRWSHDHCRLDTKAIARWYHLTANPAGWIPIVPATIKQIEAVVSGRTFPGPLIPWGVGPYDQLQDRIVPLGEPGPSVDSSPNAIETEDIGAVMAYIEASKGSTV